MPTTPQEYRMKNPPTKVITTESGAEWKIGRLPPEILSDVLKVVGLRTKPGTSMQAVRKEMENSMEKPEFAGRVFEAIKIVIPHGIREPKVVLANPAPENALSLSDITYADQFDLFMQIMDFQGLPTVAKK